MEQPKQEFKPVSGHHSGEERYLNQPRSFPVILDLREIYEAHVEDDGEESFHLIGICWFPLPKP